MNWNDILDDEQHATPPRLVTPDPVYAIAKPAMNWGALGPAFLDANAKKNKHKLTPMGIPDTLHMMIHLKLFIPLSMLTTASLSHIHFNNNLKFKKIPFGNANMPSTRLTSLQRSLSLMPSICKCTNTGYH